MSPPIACQAEQARTDDQDHLWSDPASGLVENVSNNIVAEPFPGFNAVESRDIEVERTRPPAANPDGNHVIGAPILDLQRLTHLPPPLACQHGVDVPHLRLDSLRGAFSPQYHDGVFEILAGNVNPDSGTLVAKKGTTTGYLHQDINPTSKGILLEEVTTSSASINSIAHKIKMLQEELTEEKDEDNIAGLLQELGELQHTFESHGGYDIEHEARIILSGLGVAEADFSRPLAVVRGGWRILVELVKLLFLKADLLIVDVPTNHLDLETTRWFESYLKTYQGAVLVTSHDRAFMNNVVKKVISIENEEVIFYHGNISGVPYKVIWYGDVIRGGVRLFFNTLHKAFGQDFAGGPFVGGNTGRGGCCYATQE